MNELGSGVEIILLRMKILVFVAKPLPSLKN